MKKKHVLWKLFISTLYLSAFTFGGGYVIVTLMKEKFVDELHWIEEDEMLDLIAIAQSAPGAIAVPQYPDQYFQKLDRPFLPKELTLPLHHKNP